MSDRYYMGMMKFHNINNRTDLEKFLKTAPKDVRSKQDIAAALGVLGLTKLLKDDLLEVERNIVSIRAFIKTMSFGKKAAAVAELCSEFAGIGWNKITLNDIKELGK